MNVFLPYSFTFNGYKCFKEVNSLPWFKSFNVIIGRNNSGKSSFIDIIHSLCDANFRASISKDIRITMKYRIDGYEYFDLDNLDLQIYRNRSLTLSYFGLHFIGKELIADVSLKQHNSGYNNSYDIVSGKRYDIDNNIVLLKLNDDTMLDPFNNSVFRCVSSERDITPEAFFSGADQIDIDSNGIGTTRYVCSILNNKNKKDTIIQEDVLNAFNEILGTDGHYRNIKVKQDNGDNWEIVLEDDDKNQYQISKLGSGLKTILMVLLNLIAISNDFKDKTMVFAFEELENNLHPALEKRLYSYIFNYAQKNNYMIFLTTHSPVAIDMFSREESVQFYKTERNSSGYQIVPISSFDDSIEVIDDLGIKASDLLQANGIIWVEGPSDRIYIKNWLNAKYSGIFEEGRDYQFVYYGGRLLAHYTACDPMKEEVDSYINVLAVNSKAFFVMDSDQDSLDDPLDKRKERIIQRLKEKDMAYWVTKGREIENYLDLSKSGIQLGQFDKLEDMPKMANFDKINFARQHHGDVDFNKYNLNEDLKLLANEIARWNGRELPADKC